MTRGWEQRLSLLVTSSKGRYFRVGLYLRGNRYFRGSIGREKINFTFGEPLFSEGRLFRNTTNGTKCLKQCPPLTSGKRIKKKKKKEKTDGREAIFCHFRALSLWLPSKFFVHLSGALEGNVGMLWKLYTSYNMQSVSTCLMPERRAELRSWHLLTRHILVHILYSWT